MAYTNVATNYNGDVDAIILPIFGVGNEIAEMGVARIHDQIRSKRELRRISATANPIGSYVTGELSSDTVTTSKEKRDLVVTKGTVGERFYPVDFLPEWEDIASRGDLTNLELNMRLIQAWMEVNKPAMGLQIAKNFWQGDTTLASSTGLHLADGIIKKIGADGDVITVPNIGAVTAESFFDILSRMWKAVPDVDKNNPDFAFAINLNDWEDIAVGNIDLTKSFRGVLGQMSPKEFIDKRLVPMVSLPENTIVGTIMGDSPRSNLHMGYYFSEMQETELIGRMAPSSNQWFIRLDITLGAQYTAGEKIVYYSGSGAYSPQVG